MKVWIAVLLGWIISPCFSQKDHLVTLQGDTLYGSIKIYAIDKTMDQVQIKSGKKKDDFNALQVRQLFIDGELFVTQRNSVGFKFMKPLVTGYLSLYAFRPENQTSYAGRQLVKLDGSSLEVPNLMFRGQLSSFLKDCPDLSEQIKEGEYGKNDLEQIIQNYNDCMSKQTSEPDVAEVHSEKMDRLNSLKSKVESLESLDSKSDALDIIKDIAQKIRDNKPIPNYQRDALKEMLNGEESLKAELAQFLEVLNIN